VNSLIEAITARAGIHQALSIAYSKQENGRVERANKEVYRHLNALLFHHLVKPPHDNPLSGRRPATKFDPKWAGPYEIVSHNGNTYKLKDLVVAETFIDRHIRDHHRDVPTLPPCFRFRLGSTVS
jgi:hypothetical protein